MKDRRGRGVAQSGDASVASPCLRPSEWVKAAEPSIHGACRRFAIFCIEVTHFTFGIAALPEARVWLARPTCR